MPKVSSKHQVTLPVEALKRAGLNVGNEVAIEAEGIDRIVVRRISRERIKRWVSSMVCMSPVTWSDCVPGSVRERLRARYRRRDRGARSPGFSSCGCGHSREDDVDDQTPMLLSLVNYAETLVRPAEAEPTLQVAIDAVSALGVKLITPTPRISLDAARHRALNISLADGFALATAQAERASVATFDRRVRRALPKLWGLELAPCLA